MKHRAVANPPTPRTTRTPDPAAASAQHAGRVQERAAALAQANAALEVAAAERAALLGRFVHVQEDERRHLAHEVHDGVTQLTTAAALHLDEALALAPQLEPEARQHVERARDLARQAADAARRLIAGLRPAALDELGLAGALRYEVQDLHAAGWRVSFEDGDQVLPRLSPGAEITLYRVAQEALANVRKHTSRTRVRLRLGRVNGSLRMEVRDWGCGFDPADVRARAHVGDRMGLVGMRERMALVGGQLQVRSGPQHGTTIRALLPLPEEPRA